MAIYHLEAKVISRGTGRSAVAAAAYMSCAQITNEYDGVKHDYSRKHGLIWQQIFLPENAPPEWSDRSVLWNAVEENEKTKDSRLAREFVVALPVEMEKAGWKNLLTEYIGKNFVSDGMCADVCIHDTDGHNPHAHIMVTVRPLDEQGKWQYKTEKEYLCIRNGEEKGFTSAEFKQAQKDGWEKQYQYKVGGKKEYMTPMAAKGYERVSKTPKSTRFGRQNPIAARWNSDEQLVLWRSAWADVTNRYLERTGVEARIDHRSYAERGLLEQPTIHEGVAARAMEQQGIIADRCELNRQIKADNKLLRELKKQVQKLVKAVKESVPSIAAALEALRDHMVLLQYQLIVNTGQQDSLNSQKSILSGILQEYQKIDGEIKAKNAERRSLIAEQKACGVHFIRVNKLGEQIAALTEELEELKFSKSQLLTRMGCQSSEVNTRKQKIKDMDDVLGRLEAQNTALSVQKQEDKAQFLEIREWIAPENRGAVQEERAALRSDGRKKLIQKLFSTYHDRYSTDTFEQANRQIDAELQEQSVQQKKRSIKERMKTPRQEALQPRKKNREHER